MKKRNPTPTQDEALTARVGVIRRILERGAMIRYANADEVSRSRLRRPGFLVLQARVRRDPVDEREMFILYPSLKRRQTVTIDQTPRVWDWAKRVSVVQQQTTYHVENQSLDRKEGYDDNASRLH